MTDLVLMASSTQARYLGIVEQYLIPAFGSQCLRDVTPFARQKYVLGFRISEPAERREGKPSSKGNTRCMYRESVDKIRDVMSSILGSAVKYGSSSRIRLRACMLPQRSAEAQAVYSARSICCVGRVDCRAVRHDGLRGGLYGSACQRSDRAEME